MGTRKISDYLGSGEVESIVFNPATLPPAHKEGQLSYDSLTHTLVTDNDIATTQLNIGEERRIRIINKSGFDIADGKPLRQESIDVTTGLPTVELAQADTNAHAIVLCVSTHVILDGEEGVGIIGGAVNGLDTSLLSPGLLYLDDSASGEYTDIAPDIVTVIGIVLKVDATDGLIYVDITRLLALPTIFAVMEIINDTYDLTTSYQNLVNYQSGSTFGLTIDLLAGTIESLQRGTYRGTFNITLTVPTAATTRSFTINLRNIVAGIDEVTYTAPIPKDTTEISRSFAIPFEVLADGDDLIAQIKSDVSILGVVINSISFDVQSIKVAIDII